MLYQVNNKFRSAKEVIRFEIRLLRPAWHQSCPVSTKILCFRDMVKKKT